jgi:hypothetical protein
LATAEALLGPWHLINTYTAKAAPPAARTEPQLEVMVNNTYKPVYLWHQPGDLWAGPKFVAPHQPRLDVELSAYGRRGTLLPLPHFVARLMEALCDEPQALQRLFATPLPPKPQAVRLSLWHYSFAPWTQSRDTGAYWTREHLEDGPTLVCGHNDGRGR